MDSATETVSQLLREGMTISRIVLEMIDSGSFTFEKIRDVFMRLGHYVAFSGDEHRGGMLIANSAGPLEVGATATTITWGGNGTDDVPHRNRPEEILIGVLKKQGLSIKDIVAKLVKIGLAASELRELFSRLGGYRIYGGGYGDPEGWMLVGAPVDGSDDSLARVHWGGDPCEDEESFAVLWS